MLDTRLLTVFAAVARIGSFSSAAKALHCSQPAVSQQVRALERQIGGPLFLRVGQGVQLTEAGTLLASKALPVLEELSVIEQHVRAMATGDLETLRICAFPSASATLIPRLCSRLAVTRPEVRVEFVGEEPPSSFGLLRRGECDVVIAFSYEPDPEPAVRGMTQVPLLQDRLVLLVARDSPLSNAPSVRLVDLAKERWIAGCPRCRGMFLEQCADAGFSPDIVCSTDDHMTVQSLVAASSGVAVVPRLVLEFPRHPDVVEVPVEPVVHRYICAYLSPGLARVPVVDEALRTLVGLARDIS